jgi:hypothetical protein
MRTRPCPTRSSPLRSNANVPGRSLTRCRAEASRWVAVDCAIPQASATSRARNSSACSDAGCARLTSSASHRARWRWANSTASATSSSARRSSAPALRTEVSRSMTQTYVLFSEESRPSPQPRSERLLGSAMSVSVHHDAGCAGRGVPVQDRAPGGAELPPRGVRPGPREAERTCRGSAGSARGPGGRAEPPRHAARARHAGAGAAQVQPARTKAPAPRPHADSRVHRRELDPTRTPPTAPAGATPRCAAAAGAPRAPCPAPARRSAW